MAEEKTAFFLNQRLGIWATNRPTAPAFIGLNQNVLNWQQLEQYSESCLQLFHENGLEPFDLIGIALPRSVDSAIATLALLRGSLTGLSIDRRSTSFEFHAFKSSFPFRAILTQASCVAAFERHDRQLKIAELRPWPDSDLVLILLDGNIRSYLREKDILWTLLTSGSTGKSKAVMISGGNLRRRAEGEAELFNLECGDKLLNCLSFSHDLGFNQLLTSVLTGSSLRLLSSLSPAELARQLGIEEFTGMSGTPTLWRTLLRAFDEGSAPVKTQPRYLTVSGGSLSAAELDRLRSLFPKTEWIRTYGQTETFRTLASKATSGNNLGRPIPGVRVELVGKDGRPCQPGETGELLHFGDGTMEGYLLDPKLAAKNADGAIATGDFFFQDSDGNFNFVGRRDDMIKRDDHRIFLIEIENAIREFPAILDVAVVAHGSKKLFAYVTAKKNTELQVDELKLFCRERLTVYKVPDGFLVVPALPQTESGKVDRIKLRQYDPEKLDAHRTP
jgi:acyl-CoA synthetase (AMP-forming)/AMP-acid ligase II